MEGITDQMRQYVKSTEDIMRKRPKNGKAHGVKRPDSANIVVVLAGLFVVFVVIAELI